MVPFSFLYKELLTRFGATRNFPLVFTRWEITRALWPSDNDVSAWKERHTTKKMLICFGWEISVVPISQPKTPVRCPFVPGLATGTKGATSAHVADAPFCSGWCYQPGQKVSFFIFSFLNFFSISIILLHFN